MSGGRYSGFRGCTYKSNPVAGDWRVVIKTENEKTIAVHKFTVSNFSGKKGLAAPHKITRLY